MSEMSAEDIKRAINACCGDPSDCAHYEEGTCPQMPEDRRMDDEAMEQVRTLWDL